MIINTDLKHKILLFICENCPVDELITLEEDALLSIYKEFNINFDKFHSVLKNFQDLGLIGELNARYVAVSFIVKSYAINFSKDGGFKA